MGAVCRAKHTARPIHKNGGKEFRQNGHNFSTPLSFLVLSTQKSYHALKPHSDLAVHLKINLVDDLGPVWEGLGRRHHGEYTRIHNRNPDKIGENWNLANGARLDSDCSMQIRQKN